MFPCFEPPYPSAGGMVRFLLPPTFIPGTPKSHPEITSPLPMVNLNALVDCSMTFPLSLFNLKTYLTLTLFPTLATGPFPIYVSLIYIPLNILISFSGFCSFSSFFSGFGSFFASSNGFLGFSIGFYSFFGSSFCF